MGSPKAYWVLSNMYQAYRTAAATTLIESSSPYLTRALEPLDATLDCTSSWWALFLVTVLGEVKAIVHNCSRARFARLSPP